MSNTTTTCTGVEHRLPIGELRLPGAHSTTCSPAPYLHGPGPE
ncbi:hypothetical protein [Streptomyces collinus]